MSANRLLHDEQAGDWHFRCLRAQDSAIVIALAKRGAFLTCDPILEPGEVWFEFGANVEQALARLKREVLS